MQSVLKIKHDWISHKSHCICESCFCVTWSAFRIFRKLICKICQSWSLLLETYLAATSQRWNIICLNIEIYAFQKPKFKRSAKAAVNVTTLAREV